MTENATPALIFSVFNDIGIIEQLSRTILERHLPDGLIAPHFTVLNHLIRVDDGQTPIAMARAFQVPKTSITHTLKILDARGLVEMRPNPEDGRSKQVWITERGRALHRDVISALGPGLEFLGRDFGADRFAEIAPLLRALRIFMDEHRDETARAGGV